MPHLAATACCRRTKFALLNRYRRQIIDRPPGPEVDGLLALTFEPAIGSEPFTERLIRRVGTTTAIVANYYPSLQKTGCMSMGVRGLKAFTGPDGSVVYGGKSGTLFRHDGLVAPRWHGRGRAINVNRKPQLLKTVLRIDAACRRVAAGRKRPTAELQFPRIWLGFATSELPAYEDTARLRQIAARQLGLPPEKLGGCGQAILQRFLEDVWHGQFLKPSSTENPTGLVLVNAELCTNARRALGVFEDFRRLVGEHLPNPARRLQLPYVDNPAIAILRKFQIEVPGGFDQHIPDEILGAIELEMREALGPSFRAVDQAVIFDALVNPRDLILDRRAALDRLRRALPCAMRGTLTETELLDALDQPRRPIEVPRLCRVQVLIGARTPINSSLGRRVALKL